VIPRVFDQDVRSCWPTVNPECYWVFKNAVPYERWDGMEAYIHNGQVYRLSLRGERLNPFVHAKYTGINPMLKSDDVYREAFSRTVQCMMGNMTEAEGPCNLVGPTVAGNPYGLNWHALWPYTMRELRPFPEKLDPETLRAFLAKWPIRGILFVDREHGHLAEVTRKECGLPWPVPEAVL